MSIKLRSACDKCHEAKVRCSGGAPCQGCLISRSLCLYSLSNPLGRPKGTKKKRNRGGPAGNNNAWDGDDLSAEEATTTTDVGDSSLRKRTRTRQSLSGNKDTNDCGTSGSVSNNSIISTLHGEESSDLLVSGGQASRYNSSSFITSYHGHNDVPLAPDITAPNHFRLGSLSSVDSAVQGFGESVPRHPEFSDLDSFIRSDFGFPVSSNARNPLPWDTSIYNADNENHSDAVPIRAENLDLSDDFHKASSRTSNPSHNYIHRNESTRAYPNDNSESTIPHSAPAGVEDSTSTVVQINSTESASPKASHANICTCLQKHAEILGNPTLLEIRVTDNSNGAIWSMDKALSLAKQAMRVWQDLLTCPYCPYNDDQEVMLLTFMSIRAVTRYLQRLSPRYTPTVKNHPQGTASSAPQTVQDDSCLKIGSFQLEGDDRLLVLRVLYQSTLQQVKNVLHSLQAIQEEKKKRLLEKTQNDMADVDEYQASSSFFHIQQISYGLVASLQSLSSSLHEK